MNLPRTFPAVQPACPQARLRSATGDCSRIKVFPGRGGGGVYAMQPTHIELPFSDLTPTCMGPVGRALDACSDTLDDLSAHERDIVLANLLAKYGETQR